MMAVPIFSVYAGSMVRKRAARFLFSAIAIMAISAGIVAASDDEGWHEAGSAYEQAREAVEHGEALPLQEVRRRLNDIAPGRIVSTHYEYEFDRWVYEFKIVDPEGRLQKVHLDARSGDLVLKSDY